MTTTTNDIDTDVLKLEQPEAGLATFLVVVQWEWERATYLVTAPVGHGPDKLLEQIKLDTPRDEGARVVSAHVIV